MWTLSDAARLEQLKKEPGASEQELIQLQAALGVELPNDYLDLLRHCNGAEGDPGGDRFWFRLWPAEEVPISNEQACVKELIPGLILFASDGGGTVFDIDARSGNPAQMSYVQFGAISIDWQEEEFRCNTISEFLKYLASA